ncbi:hypothetical protein EHV15_35635 [Paenibacillus oralis]|uniref:Uncharacterized protein n=1 Tax=Paenibacillus oralis TaxID=2490856 RepID=A0A3P3TA42_9BACL|nr:hypothetical protein [Paenibacillus oralis]RRJ54906.1 hypothetical protein EHV15_35635 [Paenibacillus oralis]
MLDLPVRSNSKGNVYRKLIKIPLNEVNKADEILAIESGYYPNYAETERIACYSATFNIKEGTYRIDIGLNNGNTPWLDPSLFKLTKNGSWSLIQALDFKDTVKSIIGKYKFEIEENGLSIVFIIYVHSDDMNQSQ